MDPPDDNRRPRPRLDDRHLRRSLLGFLVASQQLEDSPSLDGIAVDQMTFDRRRRLWSDTAPELIRQVTSEGVTGCLRRFNAAVENHRGLHQIKFWSRCFRGLDTRSEELRRLFFTVLPNHPTLRWFSIDADTPASLLKLLMEGITAATTTRPATATPIELEIVGGLDHLRPVPLRVVARMVQHNAPVGGLFLCRNHWAAADVQLLCDALPTNQHLRALELRGFRIIDDLVPSTLQGAWGRASPLRQLYCPHPPTDMPVHAFLDMVRALRANETLEVIAWPCPGPSLQYSMDRVDEICHLLRHHNYTLRRIEGFDRHPRVSELLSANAMVRDAHQALQRTEYHVSQLALWPHAMGRISSKPSLLYKFLRRGNCDALARHLTMAKPHAPQVTRKRRHDEEESPRGEMRRPRASRPSFWRWA